jgi:hypothetical protein
MPMKYPPLQKPVDPGFYWLAEEGEKPQIVEVCVESDSHNMFSVLLPGHDYKYPLGFWEGALWFRPLDETDLKRYKD